MEWGVEGEEGTGGFSEVWEEREAVVRAWLDEGRKGDGTLE